jgi:hypothetical protein
MPYYTVAGWLAGCAYHIHVDVRVYPILPVSLSPQVSQQQEEGVMTQALVEKLERKVSTRGLPPFSAH